MPTMIRCSVVGEIAENKIGRSISLLKPHSRRQIELGEAEVSAAKGGNGNNGARRRVLSKSTLDVAREIVRAQGPSGLYVGLMPRILKVAPACAIMISSYEHCKRYFKEKNEREAKTETSL